MSRHQRIAAAVAAAITAIVSTGAAFAYPAFGVNTDGECIVCHTDVQSYRSDIINFDGLVDPDELPGVPDRGELKYFTVQAGGVVAPEINANDGEENYAFQIKGFDDPGVTNDAPLIYQPDPDWDAFDTPLSPTYYTLSDDVFDGFDWNTDDPTQAPFMMQVNPATAPGYYLLTLALVGRDPTRLGWIDEERVYLEVTPNPAVFSLEVAPIVRGQNTGARATDATPGQNVYFVYSTAGYGNTPVGQLNVTLGVESPRLLGQARANNSGVATLIRRVPAGAPAVPVWVQAAQANRVSNVVETEIQ